MSKSGSRQFPIKYLVTAIPNLVTAPPKVHGSARAMSNGAMQIARCGTVAVVVVVVVVVEVTGVTGAAQCRSTREWQHDGRRVGRFRSERGDPKQNDV